MNQLKSANKLFSTVLIRVLPFTLLALVAVWIVFRIIAMQSVKNDIIKRLNIQTAYLADTMSLRLNSILASAETLASNHLIINALIDMQQDGPIALFFQSLHIPNVKNVKIFLTDYRGRIIASTHKTEKSYTDSQLITDVMNGGRSFQTSNQSLTVAVPVQYQNLSEGAIIIDVSKKGLDEIFLVQTSIGQYKIFDENKKVLFIQKSDNTAIADNDRVVVEKQIRGIFPLSVASYISKEIFLKEMKNLDVYLLIALGLNLLALCLSIIVTAKLVTRPLSLLVERIGQIKTSEDINFRFPKTKIFEINNLSLNFIEMLRRLNDETIERKNIENELKIKVKQLKQSESRYKGLFDNMIDGMAVYRSVADGGDFTLVEINRSGEIISRINKNDVLGGSVLNIFPGVVESGLFDVFKRVWETGKSEFHPVTLYQDDRLALWMKNSVYKLPTGEIVAVYSDESEKMQSGIARRETETKLKAIASAAQDAIIMIDDTGKTLFWNEAAETLFGFTHQELIGKELHAMIAPKDLYKAYDHSFAKFAKTGHGVVIGKTVELKAMKKNGVQFPVELSLSAVQIKEKWNAIGIVRDLTERKKMEETVIQNEKAGALGTLVAGIAHEMNNPMMGVLNFIQYCIKNTAKDDKRYAVLVDAEKETKRCAGILENLLTFTYNENEGAEKREKQSLLTIITRVIDLLSYRIKSEKIEISIEHTPSLPELSIHIGNIQQVFMNLINNAIDALINSIDKKVKINICIENGSVCATVRDSGCGIDEKDITKIFDPFYTTKINWRSIGLGLSTCRNYIHEHKGEIRCESKVGKGTTFVVLLPIV